MSMTSSAERIMQMMEFDKGMQTVMLSCTAGRINVNLYEQISQMKQGYMSLLKATGADDPFIKPQDIRQKLADLADWHARALESERRFEEAMEEFEAAARLFDEGGKPDAAQQSRDKAGEIRLELSGNFDEELVRLRDRLSNAAAGSLDRIKILVALGELHSGAKDDFEAIGCLEKAERELNSMGGHPSDDDLRGQLANTMQRIEQGEQISGASSIEMGIQRRALTQRLLLAMANAYRTTNPDKAAEYEAKIQALDDGKDSDLRDLFGQFLDAGQDVTEFLKNQDR